MLIKRKRRKGSITEQLTTQEAVCVASPSLFPTACVFMCLLSRLLSQMGWHLVYDENKMDEHSRGWTTDTGVCVCLREMETDCVCVCGHSSFSVVCAHLCCFVFMPLSLCVCVLQFVCAGVCYITPKRPAVPSPSLWPSSPSVSHWP